MGKKIEDLRDTLFAQLERLSNENADVHKEAERAEAIIKVSDAILKSARVEIEFVQVTQQTKSLPAFFEEAPKQQQLSQ